MAKKPSEVVAAVKNDIFVKTDISEKTNNIETQCVPYSSQFSAGLTQLMGSYLGEADLAEFSKATFILSLFSSGACREDIYYRELVRKEILPHIFNAAPVKLAEYIYQEYSMVMRIPRQLLTKVGFDEGYDSTKLRKFVCFRPWLSVSAVTASAYVGDLFHLIRILDYLLESDMDRPLLKEEDSYRFQAMRQLEEVERRITEQTIKDFTLLSEAADAIVAMEFGKDNIVKEEARLRLEKLKKDEEFQRLIGDQSIVEEAIAAGFTPSKEKSNQSEQPNNKGSGQNALVERKVKAENISTQYAEDAEFFTPLLRLLKASINYLVQRPDLTRDKNFAEMDNLWEIVGECHKRLFHYIKQEYFDPDKPFLADSPVDFNCAPDRRPCVYGKGGVLNLDGLGVGTNCGLYKYGRYAEHGQWHGGAGDFCGEQLGAITPLFELRTTGLRNIIKVLKNPDVTKADLVAACVCGNNEQAAKKP